MCLGVPGKIIDVYDSGGLKMGRIDFGGAVREACLAYVPEAVVGDYTIVHVGFALSILSEAEATETLDMIRQIVDLEAELGPPEVVPGSVEAGDSPLPAVVRS
jgi:hydrogenase expression/formation protein HypC